MATPTHDLGDTWLKDLFLDNVYAYKPQMMTDLFMRRGGPTEHSIRNDVAKLRSVSPKAREWIADQRMARASVGPHRDKFIVPIKGQKRYPTIICGGRQSGKSYTISNLVVTKTD